MSRARRNLPDHRGPAAVAGLRRRLLEAGRLEGLTELERQGYAILWEPPPRPRPPRPPRPPRS